MTESAWDQLGTTHVDEMARGAEYQTAKTVERLFAESVQTLRSRCPSVPIQRLMAAMWDVLAADRIRVAVGPVDVPTFALLEQGGEPVGVIALPSSWAEAVASQAPVELGRLVYAVSLAFDYDQGRGDGPEAADFRALGYMSEYARTLTPESLTELQRVLLQRMPDGIHSDAVAPYLYEWRSPIF